MKPFFDQGEQIDRVTLERDVKEKGARTLLSA